MGVAPHTFTREEAIEMNIRFAHAMIEARDNGLERFTLGPKIDNTWFVPTTFLPESPRSLIGSSAEVCAEAKYGQNDSQILLAVAKLPRLK